MSVKLDIGAACSGTRDWKRVRDDGFQARRQIDLFALFSVFSHLKRPRNARTGAFCRFKD